MTEMTDHLGEGLARTVKLLIRIKSYYLIFSTLVLALTFFLVVIFRYILHMDLFAYEEWLLPICFWMFFMGSAVGTYQNTQIKADILENYISNERIKWLRKVSIAAIELIITLFIVYWATLMLIDEFASYPQWQSTIALRIPFAVPRVGIWLGLVFMAFYSALHLYVYLKVGYQGSPDTDEHDKAGSAADEAKS